MELKPYYESANVKLFNCDCLDLLPDVGQVGCLLADPPYGIAQDTQGGARGNKCVAMPRIHIEGDDKPFDPTPFLHFPVICLWGANHYADKLPSPAGWLVWDKREGGTSDGFSDVELAWTNTLKSARMLHHKWRGMIKASERDCQRMHPTQKPIALMRWCMDILKVPQGATVFDPYCGSGSTALACIQTGRRFLGVEISEEYCEIARKRIVEAESQPKLAYNDIAVKYETGGLAI